jgi:hypothetical protein
VSGAHDLTALSEALRERLDHAVEIGDSALSLLWVSVGCDDHEFRFSWQPFREFAAVLRPRRDARPVAVLSVPNITEPTRADVAEPFPHVEITIGPDCPLKKVVEVWVGVLRHEAMPPAGAAGPTFVRDLGLAPDQLSDETRRFLTPLRRTGGALRLSQTLTTLSRVQDPDEQSAFDLVTALKRVHPEYAGDRLGRAVLTPPSAAPKLKWPAWTAAVSELYDAEAVASSAHELLSGRLFLAGLGLLDGRVRAALDATGVWTPLLLEIDDAVATEGTALRDELTDLPYAHGFTSDAPGGPDQLDIQGEVNALCDVITDPTVTPPLAVGLFGEWGSGKSFFMEKMRERVAQLAARPNRPTVVQIRFNAWHYADTSLWASLAVEIFERFADPEPISPTDRQEWLVARGDPKRQERQELLANLETYRSAKAEADAEQSRLEEEHRRVTAQLEQARRERRSAVQAFSPVDVTKALAADARVKEALQSLGGVLGATPAVTELAGLGRELRTLGGYVPAVWRSIKGRSFLVFLLTLFLLCLVGAASLLARTDVPMTSPLGAAAGSVLTALVAAAGVVRPAVERVKRALAQVEQATSMAIEVEALLRSQRDREERLHADELAAIDDRIAEASRTAASLTEKIAQTAAAAEALTVGRRLYEFLAERAIGYQRHQGVIGSLHRDFRFLDAQMRAYRAGHHRVDGLPAVERVVLYIDDLDRCPPAKVHEVLEAVHLLLALELFVVVVGVDPRYLQRSLRHRYRMLAAVGDDYLRAMPVEYLEKIFQIPLTLPAMTPKGYARLVAGLAPDVLPPAAAPEDPDQHTLRPPGSDGGQAPTRAPLTIQAGSSAAGADGRVIDLSAEELTYAQRLGPLIRSPRAAKRMMNTYRLVRATQHVGRRSRFLGTDGKPGEYQVALTLLAVASGFPALADRVLAALEHQVGTEDTWSKFVDELRPAEEHRPAGRLMPPDLVRARVAGSRGEAAMWARLHATLTLLAKPDDPKHLDDLEPYQRWGQRVARFSFTL